jgi:hypothetical protein
LAYSLAVPAAEEEADPAVSPALPEPSPETTSPEIK